VTLESRFADTKGVRLRYIEAGSAGPPIVLLHGLGSTVTKWRDTMPIIAARRRVIAVDLPGFGRSAAPRGRYTFGFLAGGITAFLDALKIERCVLVGNSLGGDTAMWLAAAHPDRVTGLVLVDPALPLPAGARPHPATTARMAVSSIPGVGELLYSAFVWMTPADKALEEGLRRNVADPSRVAPETARLLLEEAEERRRRPALRRPVMSAQRNLMWMLSAKRAEVERVARSLAIPTLLVWGSEDKLVPLATGEEWVAKIPGAELVVMEGAGHNPQVEMPDRFAEIVLAFADRLAGDAVIAPAGTPERLG
jgi:pimeloyl-ACP methyl ester carboxylesterase